MLKNYLIIGWRNLIRTKIYSIINISGLAAGMAIAILVGLWVYDEVSFNKSFKNYEHLAQLYHHIQLGGEVMTISDVPPPIGPELKNKYPDFQDVSICTWPQDVVMGYDETRISKTGMFVEPQFAKMFSLKVLEGSIESLKDQRSIFVSKSFAESWDTNTIGKMITIDSYGEYIVSGIYEDFPANSSFQEVKFIIPIASFFSSVPNMEKLTNWESWGFQCFVQLRNDKSIDETTRKISRILYDHSSNDGKSFNPEGILFPMAKWHLYNDFNDGENQGRQVRYVWMFGTIGIFVLILACINFVNLMTARAEIRAKEVGMRKVMGSIRKQLIVQFLTESFLTVFVAYIISLIIVAIAIPWFNELSDKQIFIPWTNVYFAITSLGFVLFTSLLSGSYPALYLSSLKPVKVLKGAFKAGRFATFPRKALVVFQFATSFILAIGTIVVFLQIQHARNRPVGFDRKGIFFLDVRTEGLGKADYNALRNELLATTVVENMAISDAPTTGRMAADASLTWEGKDPASQPLIALNSCSHDFPKTNGFQFIEGRDFSRDLSSDSSAVVINEMAAKIISKESAIGKTIKFGHGKERKIVGVIKDQIRWSPFRKQSAHIYFVDYQARQCLTIRLHAHAQIQDALKKVEAVIKKFDDKALFEYVFIDDDYAHAFRAEERIGQVSTVFALLALMISCVGTFGLAAFTSSQRAKEIGIRKVLGASAFSIWKLLCSDFVKIAAIGLAAGAPLAYYFADQWLKQYDYRIELSWIVILTTAVLGILITLLTVSYQAIKSALMNPVNSIRME